MNRYNYYISTKNKRKKLSTILSFFSNVYCLLIFQLSGNFPNLLYLFQNSEKPRMLEQRSRGRVSVRLIELTRLGAFQKRRLRYLHHVYIFC